MIVGKYDFIQVSAGGSWPQGPDQIAIFIEHLGLKVGAMQKSRGAQRRVQPGL